MGNKKLKKFSIEDTTNLGLNELITQAKEAPVIKLVDLIIRQAIDERASDIHIEPFENKIHLRYRVDGHLYPLPPPASHLLLPIVSRIKILSKLDIAENQLPQNGIMSARLENRTIDLRVSTIPTVWGEKVVLRVFDKNSTPLELNNLGFNPKQINALRKALTSPHGLFFVTGPTGSGKSTTLYAAINEIMDSSKNVLTVEDPVEYKIGGINQVRVRPEIGLTFAATLKAFLRQDPDIIMVGETQNLETASLCVRAALNGHFVMSALNADDAISAITHLTDIGVPNYLLAPSLITIIGQRLARCLCPKCKEPYKPTPDQHGGIKFETNLIYRAKGCESCKDTGYTGQTIVAEVLIVDDKIRALISQKSTATEIKNCAKENGMITLFDSGIGLVNAGITSFEEVHRISAD